MAATAHAARPPPGPAASLEPDAPCGVSDVGGLAGAAERLSSIAGRFALRPKQTKLDTGSRIKAVLEEEEKASDGDQEEEKTDDGRQIIGSKDQGATSKNEPTETGLAARRRRLGLFASIPAHMAALSPRRRLGSAHRATAAANDKGSRFHSSSSEPAADDGLCGLLPGANYLRTFSIRQLEQMAKRLEAGQLAPGVELYVRSSLPTDVYEAVETRNAQTFDTVRLEARNSSHLWTVRQKEGATTQVHPDALQVKPRSKWTLQDVLHYVIEPALHANPTADCFLSTIPAAGIGKPCQGLFVSAAPSSCFSQLVSCLVRQRQEWPASKQFVWIACLSLHPARALQGDVLLEAMDYFSEHLLFLPSLTQCAPALNDMRSMFQVFAAVRTATTTSRLLVPVLQGEGETSVDELAVYAQQLATLNLTSANCASPEERNDLIGTLTNTINVSIGDVEEALASHFQTELIRLVVLGPHRGQSRTSTSSTAPGSPRSAVSSRVTEFITRTRARSRSKSSDRRPSTTKDIHRALTRAGDALFQAGHLKPALVHMSYQLMQCDTAHSKGSNIAKAHVLRRMGAVLLEQGEHYTALETLDQAVNLLPVLHPDCWSFYLAIGDAHVAGKDHRSAVEAFRMSLQSLREHPETKAFQERIAKLLTRIADSEKALGNFQGAAILFTEVVSLQRACAGNGSLPVAQTLIKVAQLMHEIGRHEKALQVIREVEDSLSLLLAQSSSPSDSSSSSRNLRSPEQILEAQASAAFIQGQCLASRQDVPQAINAFMRAINARPGDTRAKNLAASLLKQQGDYRESLQLYVASLPKSMEQCTAEHTATLNDLANLLLVLGHYDLALTSFEQCLKVKRATGAEDISLAITRNGLAVILKKLNRYSESMAHYRAALRILVKEYGENHPQVADTLENMTLLLETQAKSAPSFTKRFAALNKAQLMQKQVVAIRTITAGALHNSTVKSKRILQRLEAAIASFERG